MILAAVCIAHNERDIVWATSMHMLEQGVDTLTIVNHRSTDGTAEILAELAAKHPGRVEVWQDHAKVFEQARLTNELANAARARGASWILPFDADEFWVARRHMTLRDAFASVDRAVDVVSAKVYQHLDWRRRTPEPQILRKLVIRAEPATRRFETGNHFTSPPPARPLEDLVEVREISYRSEEHFLRKSRERIATLRPHGPAGENVHYKERIGKSDGELRLMWRERQSGRCVFSPVPSRFQV